MTREQSQKIIFDEFLKDNTMEFTCGEKCMGFDKILHSRITKYDEECFKEIIITQDLGNIRIFEYVLNGNVFTSKCEITISREDFNAVHRVA